LLRQLLSHTAGYSDYYPLDYIAPFMAAPTTPQAIMAKWGRQPLNFTPDQRWGVGRVRLPRGWKLYFKGGWGSGTGAVDHQIALLERGAQRVSVAVLTTDDPSHEYGKETLRGIFARLLHTLPSPSPHS